MAIIPKICIQLEADSSKFTITDDIGETVTNFNDNGYGGVNPDRSNYAAVLLAYYQPYEGNKTQISDLEVHIDYSGTYSNAYKTVFELSYLKDGWHEFNYILVPTSITPVEGGIIYSDADETLMQYTPDLQLVALYDITKLLETTNYLQVKEESLYTSKLSTKKNELGREWLACTQCVECGCKEEFDILIKLRQGLEAAHSLFIVSRFESQRMIERLTKQFRIK